MARSIKRILESKAQDHTFLFPPNKRKSLVWDCRRWGFDSASSRYKHLWVTGISVKTRNIGKIPHKVFLEWRRSSKLKIILLNTASAVSFLLGESELRLTVQRCDQQPLETNEKALLGSSARSRLHHYKAASVPLFSSSMSGETELQTGLCNKQFKGKVYKNAILKDWEHGQFTLKLCNSCSAQGWQMLPPPLRYGEREIKCVSCFYCVMLLSNLWKISHIKRNLWGECEQAFWNRIIQKKCCRYFKIPWEVYNPHTARREKNHSW